MAEKFEKFSGNQKCFHKLFQNGENWKTEEKKQEEASGKKFKKKRIVQIVVGIICLVGCIFQLYIFLELFLSYPTRTEVSIEHADRIQLPAITICHGNRLRKSVFCDRDDVSCDLKTMKEFEDFEKQQEKLLIEESASMLKETGHNISEFVNKCVEMGSIFNNTYYWSFNWNFGNCFTINGNLTGNLLPVNSTGQKTFYIFHLSFAIEDSFFLQGNPSVQMVIHDMYDMPDPWLEGFPIQPGYMTIIRVQKSVSTLLSRPYHPHCVDYPKQWEANGKRGPISKQMCEYECYWNASLAECGCVAFFNSSALLTEQVADKKCTRAHGIDIEKCGNEAIIKAKSCLKNCPLDCKSSEYSPHIISKTWPPSTLLKIIKMNREEFVKQKKLDHSTEVYILFGSSEVMHSSKKPQFQDIELYGYIGGYLGMWMGVSLLNVFHGIFVIATYAISKALLNKSQETPLEKY